MTERRTAAHDAGGEAIWPPPPRAVKMRGQRSPAHGCDQPPLWGMGNLRGANYRTPASGPVGATGQVHGSLRPRGRVRHTTPVQSVRAPTSDLPQIGEVDANGWAQQHKR